MHTKYQKRKYNLLRGQPLLLQLLSHTNTHPRPFPQLGSRVPSSLSQHSWHTFGGSCTLRKAQVCRRGGWDLCLLLQCVILTKQNRKRGSVCERKVWEKCSQVRGKKKKGDRPGYVAAPRAERGREGRDVSVEGREKEGGDSVIRIAPRLFNDSQLLVAGRASSWTDGRGQQA